MSEELKKGTDNISEGIEDEQLDKVTGGWGIDVSAHNSRDDDDHADTVDHSSSCVDHAHTDDHSSTCVDQSKQTTIAFGGGDIGGHIDV